MNDVSIIIPTNRGPPIVGLKVEEKKRGNRSMRERCGREKCDGGGWCYCYYWYHRSGDCDSLLSICTQELKSTIKFHPLAANAPIPIPISTPFLVHLLFLLCPRFNQPLLVASLFPVLKTFSQFSSNTHTVATTTMPPPPTRVNASAGATCYCCYF